MRKLKSLLCSFMSVALPAVAVAATSSLTGIDSASSNASAGWLAPACMNKTALEFEMEQFNGRAEKAGEASMQSFDSNASGITSIYKPSVVKTKNPSGENMYCYEYYYDSNATDYPEVGPMVQVFRQWNPDLNGYENTARYVVVPDEFNNVAYYYQDKFSDGHWINSYRFVGTYDAAGHELSGTKEYWENNKWVARSRWENEYDSDGNRISMKSKTFTQNDEDWVDGERYFWEFENGFLTKYTYWSKADGVYVKTMERFYENDAEGRVLTMTQQQLEKNIARERYNYDDKGQMLSYVSERWNEQKSSWYAQGYMECTYDEAGRLTSETQSSSSAQLPFDETVWVATSERKYTYEDNTETVTTSKYDAAGEKWMPYSRVKTTYNSRGDKIMYQTATLNSSTGNWETRAESVWEYDSNNNLVSFKGENIFGETRSLSSAYSYTYDEHNNAISALYQKLGYRESVSLPYNNMADVWTGKFDFVSNAADAEYVNVATDYVMPASVSFDREKMSLRPNETAQLEAKVLPENASNKFVHWNVADNSVAFVDVEGRITALALGETEITATTIEGLHVARLSLAVTVDGEAGIDMLPTDAGADTIVNYYNLQGMPVSNPVPGQIYIRRCGSNAEKIVFGGAIEK